MNENFRVFPTGVGVNRVIPLGEPKQWRFPHRRGGEPDSIGYDSYEGAVFPTGVGVNR